MNYKDMNFAIIKSEFNQDIIEGMVQGAMRAAAEEGICMDQISQFVVPGAFELPLAAQRAALTKAYDAVVCIGAVLKGETAHFDYVSLGVTKGIQDVSLKTNCPILFGVLTCDRSQAVARSQGEKNKGYHTFKAALKMTQTLFEIDSSKEKLLR